MAPIALTDADSRPLAAAAPQVLDHNIFQRDRGGMTDAELDRILSSPTFLSEGARLGIVPVQNAYGPSEELPVVALPGALADRVEGTGIFEAVSEVSSDFPSDRNLVGLREIAARYRADYLLLYRHRFQDRDHPNAWAVLYTTVIGIPFLPGRTLETAGVVEATLYDVRSGTLLFTVFQRVHEDSQENIWQNDRKKEDMRERLLAEATEKLTDQVVAKLRRLVASRPAQSANGLAAGSEPGRL
ncbi:MAG: hypothetical protein U1E65_27035 [Myxococcota bacterium]